MSILSRNRMPISDERIKVNGIPHRILSKPDSQGYFEAVDPWGNQIIMRRTEDGVCIPSDRYIGKHVYDSLRRTHPEVAEALDTDYSHAYRTATGYVYDHRGEPGLDDFLVRIRTYDKNWNGEYTLRYDVGSVRSTRDYYKRMSEAYNRGIRTEPLEDPETGSAGTRVIEYDPSAREWWVEDWVRTSDMEAFFAKPDTGFTKPKPRKKNSGSKNIRGGGRR